MHAYASREEWIWRSLAIATILLLVGMAVMPLAVGGEIISVLVQTGHLGLEWGWVSISLGAAGTVAGFWNPWAGAALSIASL